jgi:cellulose synthase/poly-beta-1,6-N-acetylglucosamine synthase-like glycosyltransferase
MRNRIYKPRYFLTICLLILLAIGTFYIFKLSIESTHLINLFLFPLQSVLLIMCFYTFLPAFVFVAFRRDILSQYIQPIKINNSTKGLPKFILLIPAHNEANTLPALLESIARLEYPVEYKEVIVIADNCTDNTAQIAKEANITVYERKTTIKSDKTQALRFAADIFSSLHFDAEKIVLIIDADCKLSVNYLYGIAEELINKPDLDVIQSHRIVGNQNDSDVCLLDAASEALRQKINSGTRNWLGLENYLYGLGTGFRLPLFVEMTRLDQLVFADDKAWKAHLNSRKIEVGYAPKAVVAYTACTLANNFQVQRLRWVTGHYDMIKRFYVSMFTQSIRRLNLSQLDFSLSIITLPRSFLMLFCFVFFVISIALPYYSFCPSWIWAMNFVFFFIYVALGLHTIESTKYSTIFTGYRVVLGVIKANFLSLMNKGSQGWGVERELKTK